MTTKSTSGTPHSLIPWKKRASFKASKSKRTRKRQLARQMNMIYVLVGAAIIFGSLFIFINWQNAGAAKSVSCAEFPYYCVPLAGGAAGDYADLEAEGVRELDEESHGAPGVVRYVTEDHVPTIGDPNAAIHIRVVSNFACGHCNTYHTGDLERFIENYALIGQATVGFALVTNTGGGNYARIAALGALCAGEQGAFWEMSDEMFRLARAGGSGAFTLNEIMNSAANMDLDADEIESCIVSGNYDSILDQQS
ncbi:MAG: DsbA family protein, partial [Anaerolineae bacterium]|nr:DsbA family protein [Anaerolineae bacterium]